METTHDAKATLEAEGLYVSCNNDRSLWVAATVRDAGEGVKLSHDACSLLRRADRWVAVFPAGGLLTYEVAGQLPELVALVTAVYADYRRAGGPFPDAFRRAVADPDQYLVGRTPAHV